jgi:hypothetical protein
MKAILVKFGAAVVFAMLGFLLAGCSTPPANWENRIGNFTYAQAETELGKPAKTTTLDNGGIFAEWVTARNVKSDANTGLDTGMRAGGIEQPLNQSMQITKTEYLDLTFAPNGKLAKWEKVYR